MHTRIMPNYIEVEIDDTTTFIYNMGGSIIFEVFVNVHEDDPMEPGEEFGWWLIGASVRDGEYYMPSLCLYPVLEVVD